MVGRYNSKKLIIENKGDKGVKNLEIYNLYKSLSDLSCANDIKLSAKIGYICIKNKKIIEPYFQTIDESRINIIQNYLKEDEEGNLRVPEDKIKEANEKLQEILDIEEDVNIQKVNINDIQESLPMDILTGLMPMLIDEKEN